MAYFYISFLVQVPLTHVVIMYGNSMFYFHHVATVYIVLLQFWCCCLGDSKILVPANAASFFLWDPLKDQWML